MSKGFSINIYLPDGDPDGLARPLSGGFAPIPWSDGAGAQALCQMCDPATSAPYWYEPRAVLERVEQLAERFLDKGHLDAHGVGDEVGEIDVEPDELAGLGDQRERRLGA